MPPITYEDVNGYAGWKPNQPLPNLPGPTLGSLTGTEYGSPVTYDADRRGFTNASGGHDWLPGFGPGGNWNGEDQKTGQAPIGQDPGSGDALGIPRGTPEYRQATAAHKAWIQQNRAAGRTLADLGMTPTRGGGLANYMELAGTPRGNPGGSGPNPVNPGGMPTNPASPTAAFRNPNFRPSTPVQPLGSLGPVASNPITGGFGAGANRQPTPNAPRMASSIGPSPNPMSSLGFGATQNPATPGTPPPNNASIFGRQGPKRPRQMGSLGFNQSPINTARVM